MSYEDELLTELILQGAIEIAGVDSKGELMYAFTPKIQEIMPELYQEHMRVVSIEIMSLWQRGYLNVDLLSDNPIITITEKALDPEELAKLSDDDRWSIEEIKRVMRR